MHERKKTSFLFDCGYRARNLAFRRGAILWTVPSLVEDPGNGIASLDYGLTTDGRTYVQSNPKAAGSKSSSILVLHSKAPRYFLVSHLPSASLAVRPFLDKVYSHRHLSLFLICRCHYFQYYIQSSLANFSSATYLPLSHSFG
jgi:hypothetical protein